MLENLSPYDLLVPPKVVFGWGRRTEVGALASTLGRRAFVIHGSRTLETNGVLAQLLGHLTAAGLETVALGVVTREPRVTDVDAMTEEILRHQTAPGDLVVAIGGGSALDLGKAVAAMATNRRASDSSCLSVRDFLEGVGTGAQLAVAPLPVLAIPTTAGTGSEATKNAVISNDDPPFKKSLRSDAMVPRAVLIDPELTVSMSPAMTAHTGMDAITQLIESYISCRAKPIPRALAMDGLRLAVPAIELAIKDGTHRAAREAMAHAAFLSGVALANSGLGMAHGVAAALGIHCDVPHGLACAVMLPPTLRANQQIAAKPLAELGRAVGSTELNDAAAAEAFIQQIESLCRSLQIPATLREIGVRPWQLPQLVQGSRGNSMNGNPRPIDDGELTQILERIL
ncbi:MAG: iron-containing alcohol dehydrogenase [Planctomycetota bacterium]|nr:iron-containing alcohol dehydrogenase [Planctomycetota bacterium]